MSQRGEMLKKKLIPDFDLYKVVIVVCGLLLLFEKSLYLCTHDEKEERYSGN